MNNTATAKRRLNPRAEFLALRSEEEFWQTLSRKRREASLLRVPVSSWEVLLYSEKPHEGIEIFFPIPVFFGLSAHTAD